jgi:hypothetical protein
MLDVKRDRDTLLFQVGPVHPCVRGGNSEAVYLVSGSVISISFIEQD